MEPVHQPVPTSGNGPLPFSPAMITEQEGDASSNFSPMGKSPQQLVRRVQQQMQRGQKLSVQEMNWAFAHGGFYFHQQAGLHNRRLRMREEADAKKQGAVTESNDNAEQKVSGTGVTEGVSKDGKLVQDGNTQNLNVQNSNAQNLNVQNDDAQKNNAQNSNAQTETVSAGVKQESSTNEPVLTNAERNDALKENGQVVNADATQNAVEQPVVNAVQPKGDDVGEEKKRNIQPDMNTEYLDAADDIDKEDLNMESTGSEFVADDGKVSLGTTVKLDTNSTATAKSEGTGEKSNGEQKAETESEKEEKGEDEQIIIANTAEELNSFKREINEAKKQLSQKEQSRISKIDQAAKQNIASIDLKTSHTILSADRCYDNAIKAVQGRLKQTQKKIFLEKGSTINNIKSDTEQNIRALDKQIGVRQTTLILAGDSEAKRLENYRDLLLKQAGKVTSDNKSTLHRHADQLIKKYSWSERISDIKTDMHKMATSTGIDQFDETYNSLKEGLDEDTEEIAGGIREEAADNITSFPDGKDEAAKQMREVRDLMIAEVNKFGSKELSEFEKEANRTIGELKKAKAGVILDISQKGKDAKAAIASSSTDLKATVKKTVKQNKLSLDALFADVTNDAPEQPDVLTVEQINASRTQLAEITKGDDLSGNKLVKTAKTNLKSIANRHIDSLAQTEVQVIDSVDKTKIGFSDTCEQYETNFINGYSTIRAAANEEMGKISDAFLKLLDDQILEAKTEWSGRIDEAMPEMFEKQQEMIAGQKQALLERMTEMSDEAKRLSTAGWLSDTWHAIYEFGAGLLGFLADLVIGLLKIIGIIILAILVIAALIALFAGGGFLAALGSVLAFLVVWGPIILKVLLVVGIVIGAIGSWKKFKKAFTDPNLTFGERMKLIGSGIGEAVTTIGLGWLKFGKLGKFSKFTALFGEWKGLKAFFAESKLAKNVVNWFGGVMSKATKMKESGFFTPQGITSFLNRFKTGQQMNKIFTWTNNQLTLLERWMSGVGDDADKLEGVVNSGKKADEIDDASSSATDDISNNLQGLYRRDKNIGEFSELKVNMELKTVKYYAEQGGVGLNGIKIKIVRDKDLIGRGLYGYAHPDGRTITLYPDAFTDINTLISTLGHERTHIMQFNLYGVPTSTTQGALFEKAAFEIEPSFINYYSKYGKKK